MSDFQKINKVARSQVGVHEGKDKSGNWNNDQKYSDQLPGFKWSDGQAWCATFVCWVFWKTGNLDLLPSPSASVDALAAGFKANGRFSEYPAKGAVAFYGVPSDLNHTGIVVDYDQDFIYVVEGNTNDNGSREGDGVYLKKRERRGANVIGYGLPKFAEPIESADPKFAKPTAPKPKATKPSVSLKHIQRAARFADWTRNIGPRSLRADVAVVERALKAEKVAHYRAWQRKSGATGRDANGVPSKGDLVALGRKHGFTVTD